MIGRSAAFLASLQLIQKIARYDATVLIEGETGTGKELAARAIHYQGPRQREPFVPVNCGALPDQLVENEFFGHRKGAFTDARADSPGLLALAHGGTLFLDEIDSLSPKAQVLLLRALQDQRFRPLGAKEEVAVDIRIISASNRSLQSLVDCGQFREDLLFRINLLYLELPPLRDRVGDPELLASEFVGRFSERYQRPLPRIEAATLEWFRSYAWPGNVRELENLVHREFLLCDNSVLAIEPPRRRALPSIVNLPSSAEFCASTKPLSGGEARDQIAEPSVTAGPYSRAKAVALSDFNQRYLRSLLATTRGNVSEAARYAGKERRALGRLLKRYGVSAEVFRV